MEFRHRRGDAISNELDRPPSWNENWLGGRLRASVSPMGDVSAAQVGSLGHAKESTELAERRLGESLREEVGDVHIRRDITHTK